MKEFSQSKNPLKQQQQQKLYTYFPFFFSFSIPYPCFTIYVSKGFSQFNFQYKIFPTLKGYFFFFLFLQLFFWLLKKQFDYEKTKKENKEYEMNKDKQQQQSDTSVKNKSFKGIEKIFCNKHFYLYKKKKWRTQKN